MTMITRHSPTADSSGAADSIHESHLPWQLEFTAPVVPTTREVSFGRARTIACRIGPLRGWRRSAELRRTPGDFVGLMLVRRGHEYVEQFGRTALVQPGCAVLWDGVRPMSCATTTGLVKQTLFFPRDSFCEMFPRPDELFVRVLEPSLALRLLARWLSALIDECDEDDPAEPTIDIAAELMQVAVGELAASATDSRVVLLTGIKAYIDRHLADPGLTLPAIAAANAVSVRFLHSLFAQIGETPAGYLRRRRLGLARDLLLRSYPPLAVHAVGERCGFTNHSVFSRAFRARFGESPRETRGRRPAAAGPSGPATGTVGFAADGPDHTVGSRTDDLRTVRWIDCR
jgi:AraC-like DNA-binding protein